MICILEQFLHLRILGVISLSLSLSLSTYSAFVITTYASPMSLYVNISKFENYFLSFRNSIIRHGVSMKWKNYIAARRQNKDKFTLKTLFTCTSRKCDIYVTKLKNSHESCKICIVEAAIIVYVCCEMRKKNHQIKFSEMNENSSSSTK